MIKEAFDWLILIVGGLESEVVVLEVSGRDAIVFGIKVVEDVASG